MDEKNKRVIIVSIIALAIVLVTASYAYFSARITGLENASTISMTAGRMGIVYSEGDENISVNDIYPREDAWITKTITLTAYNNTNLDMEYSLGIDITTNTFKGGELTYDLTGVGVNGEKIADITGKAIVGHDRFLKFGSGSFTQANGDTHVYTLKIYFKDNGKDQNYNQGAVFNGKINVKEYTPLRCYTSDSEFVDVYEGILSYDINKEVCINYFAETGYTEAEKEAFCNGEVLTLKEYYGPNPEDYETYTESFQERVIDYRGVRILDTGVIYNVVYDTSTNYLFSQYDKGDYSYRIYDPSKAGQAESNDIPEDGYEVIQNDKYSATSVTTPLCAYINDIPVTMMNSTFYGSRSTIIDLSTFDTSKVTDMSAMFLGASITNLDLSHFDTSNVTNMEGMFSGNSSFTNLDLSSFDTSNVTNMGSMFSSLSVNNLDLSSFNTSRVTDMQRMFGDSQIANVDISLIDTSNVTNMYCMFKGANMSSLDISGFDTSKVTNMGSMFSNSTGVSSLDLSTFDTSKVTNMRGMFSGNSSFTNLDLSSFDTSKVTNMYEMFKSNANLTTIYTSDSFVTTALAADASSAGSTRMFSGDTNLVGGAGTTYDANHIDKTYAHIDGGTSNPGYFTDIKDKLSN